MKLVSWLAAALLIGVTVTIVARFNRRAAWIFVILVLLSILTLHPEWGQRISGFFNLVFKGFRMARGGTVV